ncbi:glycosyltransferase family 1 protein [Megasphaera sp. SW808]|jgi:glycosyltransferase involved in cell wall biosynthesis|uniref:glycosyltransferase family 4 protein n=1 Tax=Megasphaera sp. SW808 TaxID=2530045 RepID=UPI00143C374A|nr:glycosyltransferase family 4 protein [Megasphaera sp. SW808]NJE35609.1 glycosyltransferase family 1 protein [Megasphaera sp. SW808]
MRIAILESIVMPAGHEVEFDRILVDELKRQGHTPVFFVPERFPFKLDYHCDVDYLTGGEVVTYAGAGKLKKIFLSIRRERRRIAWFNSAYEKACAGTCDAIIIPTGTWRYIRTVLNSKLKDSPVPVYMIFHGINPHEQPKFEKQARRVEAYKQIHLKVITLRDDFQNSGLRNVDLIAPPVFKPQDMPVDTSLHITPPVKIGFFGQFRKEKNLGFFLEAFTKAKFSVPVELIVQGATAKPEDGEIFDNYAKDYADYKNITFWHKNLIGLEWQKALLSVDAIMMPYAAERYRYHWGAMLFTAIGFYKPVLASPELNPEVLEKYKIGMAVDLSSVDSFARQLERFVDDLVKNGSLYITNLKAANLEYSHEALISNILCN